MFILTALLTLLMGSVNFFNADKIVRYLIQVSPYPDVSQKQIAERKRTLAQPSQ